VFTEKGNGIMTEKNTEIMRDLFRLLSEFESVPEDENLTYWNLLIVKANEMARRWELDPLAVNLAIGLIDGLQEKYKRKPKIQQLRMDAVS
jgi:hypothetical protein